MKISLFNAMVVAIALVVSACSSASDAGDENVDPAVAVVVSALDAKNSGDLAGWLAFHKDGKNPNTPLHAEQILMNANQRLEVVEPCQVKAADAEGNTTVECVIHDVNDFWGVGGIGDTKPGEFIVNEDLLITYRQNIFGSSRRDQFNASFHLWLRDTHPDVWDDSGFRQLSSNGPGFDVRNADLMAVAVEYVEEFVAQSDTYPLDQSDQ